MQFHNFRSRFDDRKHLIFILEVYFNYARLEPLTHCFVALNYVITIKVDSLMNVIDEV